MRACIERELDQAIIGAGPDFAGACRRWGDGVDDPVRFATNLAWFWRGVCRCRVSYREVGADGLPALARVFGAQDELRAKIEDVGILRRVYERGRPGEAQLAAVEGNCGRRNIETLAGGPIEATQDAEGASAVDDVLVRAIDDDVAAFLSADGRPIAKSDLAVIAAAGDGGGAAILLRAVNAIGETIVGCDVIELRRRLVVPGGPCGAAVEADGGALIAAENHARGVVGSDPQSVVIIAAGSAFYRFEIFSAVGGAIERGVGDVHYVWVARIRGDTAEIPAALPDARVRRRAARISAGVVGATDAAFARVNETVNAVAVVARGDCDSDAAQTFAGETVTGDLTPGDAVVGGFVEAAAGAAGGRVNIPGRAAGLPQGCVDDLGLSGVGAEIDRTAVVIFPKNFGPGGAAIAGA